MSQSHVQVYLHIIFSTKYRAPLILPHIEVELYQLIEHQCNQLGCIAIEVGGCIDHVHILCRLSKHISIPKLLESIKGASSKGIKSKYSNLTNFYWQDGYGAFSESPKEVDNVSRYIRSQHEHHISKTFKEEYLELLHKNDVKFDHQYLWDDAPSEKG